MHFLPAAHISCDDAAVGDVVAPVDECSEAARRAVRNAIGESREDLVRERRQSRGLEVRAQRGIGVSPKAKLKTCESKGTAVWLAGQAGFTATTSRKIAVPEKLVAGTVTNRTWPLVMMRKELVAL